MMLPRPRILALAALFGLGMGWMVSAKETAPSLDAAWEDASMLLVQEAYGQFSTARKLGVGNLREIDYALAVTLLNLQPRTTGNINRAAELLTRLNVENPDDEIGIASLYFRARLEQVHRNNPDIPQALELYGRLVREHPGHFYAQHAAAKIAIIKLFASPTQADKKRALSEVELLIPLLRDPAARCNFALILGTACIRFNLGDDKALRYFVEADALGIPVQLVEGNVLIRIGNLALRKGQRALAITYFERFLKEFPRNIRSHTVREKLQELKGGTR